MEEAVSEAEPQLQAVDVPVPVESAAAPRLPAERLRKKRKLEEEEEEQEQEQEKEGVGFHNSTYYRIRKIVRNLRPAFLQLFQDPNFGATTLTADILKEIKTVLELSKQLRTDLAAITEPRKASSIPPAKDEPNEEAFPPAHQADNVNNSISSEEAVAAEPKDVPFNLDDGLKGSYVVGGSPVGWNFLVYPGSKPVYYGRTKAQKQAHQIQV